MDSMPLFQYANSHFPTGRNVPYHQHYGIELILVTTGHCRISSPLGTLSGGPGALFVIPPRISHNQEDSPDEHNFYCVFNCEPDLFQPRWGVWNTGGLGWVKRYFWELKSMTNEYELRAASALLASMLIRLKKFDLPHEFSNPKLQAAINFIQRNYAQPIAIGDVCRYVVISSSSLRQLFKTALGISPMKYLLELRMKKGKILLHDPYLSVSEIAEQCGINSNNYFTRLYKQFWGVTPCEARENILKGDK